MTYVNYTCLPLRVFLLLCASSHHEFHLQIPDYRKRFLTANCHPCMCTYAWLNGLDLYKLPKVVRDHVHAINNVESPILIIAVEIPIVNICDTIWEKGPF